MAGAKAVSALLLAALAATRVAGPWESRSIVAGAILLMVLQRFGHFLLSAPRNGQSVPPLLPHQPLTLRSDGSWMNLGLWRDPLSQSANASHRVKPSFREANEAMAAKLAGLAGLAKASRVLDLGFGWGDQCIFWLSSFPQVRTRAPCACSG
jgi:hypothetical protein